MPGQGFGGAPFQPLQLDLSQNHPPPPRRFSLRIFSTHSCSMKASALGCATFSCRLRHGPPPVQSNMRLRLGMGRKEGTRFLLVEFEGEPLPKKRTKGHHWATCGGVGVFFGENNGFGFSVCLPFPPSLSTKVKKVHARSRGSQNMDPPKMVGCLWGSFYIPTKRDPPFGETADLEASQKWGGLLKEV